MAWNEEKESAPCAPSSSPTSRGVAIMPSRLETEAPQTAFGEERPMDRLFVPAWPDVFVEEMKVGEKLAREQKFDPDLWIVDIDDRDGRPFVEIAEA